MILLKNDIFVLPTSNEDKYIIYSPLRGISFWANKKAAAIVQNYIEKGIEIPTEHTTLHKYIEDMKVMSVKEPTRKTAKKTTNDAVFVLSQKCNLACSYCYALSTRSQNTLCKEKIKTVVDFVLSNPSDGKKSFSFIGGGEPTVDWDLFVWAIEYIKSKSQNQKLSLGITTNATLLDEKRVLWLKDKDIGVGISFDILPEIQNKQRPFPDKSKNSFDVVDKNIRLLIENERTKRIRSTITSDSVTLMPKMVQFVIDNYPQIKKLHFEPVTDPREDLKDYYGKFVEYFFPARNIGAANGVNVYNSMTNCANRVQTRFCAGEFCVTPRGEIVTCHRVSSDDDENFKNFCYGEIGDTIEINDNAAEYVDSVADAKMPRCKSCFAKWHCAGMCTNTRLLLSDEQLVLACDFTKTMIIKTLEEKLNKPS